MSSAASPTPMRRSPSSARTNSPSTSSFSDVIMPGMNGVELAGIIRERYPGLPVVLTSGYSNVLAENAHRGFELIQKPYSVEIPVAHSAQGDLGEAVGGAIGDSSPSSRTSAHQARADPGPTPLERCDGASWSPGSLATLPCCWLRRPWIGAYPCPGRQRVVGGALYGNVSRLAILPAPR